jgi:hypothetical protein
MSSRRCRLIGHGMWMLFGEGKWRLSGPSENVESTSSLLVWHSEGHRLFRPELRIAAPSR